MGFGVVFGGVCIVLFGPFDRVVWERRSAADVAGGHVEMTGSARGSDLMGHQHDEMDDQAGVNASEPDARSGRGLV